MYFNTDARRGLAPLSPTLSTRSQNHKLMGALIDVDLNQDL